MNDDKYTIESGLLDTGDGHKIYYQLWGNKLSNNPILSTHGGPGGQCKDKHKRLYDPKQHLVLFFDQRGCGQSLPYGSITNNNLQATLRDIDNLAIYFKFNKFSIVGGSWSSCIALTYALYKPLKVVNLYLDGIFTSSQEEIDFIEKGLFVSHFPDHWENYVKATPKEHKGDPSAYHLNKVLGNNIEQAQHSAYIHDKLESGLVSLDTNLDTSPMDPEYDYMPSKIYAHYIINRCFLNDDYILNNAHKIKATTYIIQGRYDMICPPITAYKLSNNIPNCSIIWTIAGHVDRSTIDAKKALLAMHY